MTARLRTDRSGLYARMVRTTSTNATTHARRNSPVIMERPHSGHKEASRPAQNVITIPLKTTQPPGAVAATVPVAGSVSIQESGSKRGDAYETLGKHSPRRGLVIGLHG